MWRDEQFGLSFLSALNHFAKHKRPPMSPEDFSQQTPGDGNLAGFSVRGVLFLHFYCVVASLNVFNVCLQLHSLIEKPCLAHCINTFNEVLPFVLMHMVLLMHSAVVLTPKMQPYHVLVITTRWLALAIGANSCATFCSHVLSLLPFPPLPHLPQQVLAGVGFDAHS